MTANLINYWKHKEQQRSNLVNEAETERSHRAMESYNWASLGEARRHNMSVEGEAAKHNREQEGIARQSNLLEASRQQETSRHNKAAESQAYYDNKVRFQTSQWNYDVGKQQANTAEKKIAADAYTNAFNGVVGVINSSIRMLPGLFG